MGRAALESRRTNQGRPVHFFHRVFIIANKRAVTISLRDATPSSQSITGRFEISKPNRRIAPFAAASTLWALSPQRHQDIGARHDTFDDQFVININSDACTVRDEDVIHRAASTNRRRAQCN